MGKESAINGISKQENKAYVRAWLLMLLARVEICESVTGDKQESGSTVEITLNFR